MSASISAVRSVFLLFLLFHVSAALAADICVTDDGGARCVELPRERSPTSCQASATDGCRIAIDEDRPPGFSAVDLVEGDLFTVRGDEPARRSKTTSMGASQLGMPDEGLARALGVPPGSVEVRASFLAPEEAFGGEPGQALSMGGHVVLVGPGEGPASHRLRVCVDDPSERSVRKRTDSMGGAPAASIVSLGDSREDGFRYLVILQRRVLISGMRRTEGGDLIVEPLLRVDSDGGESLDPVRVTTARGRCREARPWSWRGWGRRRPTTCTWTGSGRGTSRRRGRGRGAG